MELKEFLTPGKGIYTITVKSEFNGFCQWYVIHVERAPDAAYQAPHGYVKVSSAENISTSGVVVSETYMPTMVLDLQKLIIVVPDKDMMPKTGPSAGIPTMTIDDLADIGNNAFNIDKVFHLLLNKVESDCEVDMNSKLQKLYSSFGKLFMVPPHLVRSILQMARITPQQAMGRIYSGLGLILKQIKPCKFLLTDLVTAMAGTPQQVLAEDIVSISTSYDYTKIPKTQTINFATDGSIIQESIASSVDPKALVNEKANDAKGLYSDKLIQRASPGASLSEAVGLGAHILMQPVPLLARVGLKDAIADKNGKVKITIGDVTEVVQLSKIIKIRDSLKKKKKLSEKDKEWDYAAAIVTAKRMFMEKLQQYMNFTVIQGSTLKTIVIDGAVGEHFGNIALGGGTTLQKAVINSKGVTYETEMGRMDDAGFVTGLTVVMQGGITTSTITYVNLSESYKGIF